MTRDQSLAWINALDAYLRARSNRVNAAERGYSPALAGNYEDEARETLVEAMIPIVTGERR